MRLLEDEEVVATLLLRLAAWRFALLLFLFALFLVDPLVELGALGQDIDDYVLAVHVVALVIVVAQVFHVYGRIADLDDLVPDGTQQQVELPAIAALAEAALVDETHEDDFHWIDLAVLGHGHPQILPTVFLEIFVPHRVVLDVEPLLEGEGALLEVHGTEDIEVLEVVHVALAELLQQLTALGRHAVTVVLQGHVIVGEHVLEDRFQVAVAALEQHREGEAFRIHAIQ